MATAPGAPDGAREQGGAANPEPFKAAFRRLASGVCVVMFRRHGRPHGFTATSVTSSCWKIASSTSIELTFSPPVMITSFLRSAMLT